VFKIEKIFLFFSVQFEQRNRSKLIHVSTDEVYGDIKKNHRSKETDPYNPSSPYSASKAAGDLLVRSYVRTYKIPAIITNCCNNFGPNQYPEKLIPTVIYNILNKKLIPIYGKGKNEREWIYVEDHCNALIKIADKGIIGENYNIGSGHVFNNVQLTQKIILIYKKFNKNIKYNFKIKFIKDRPGHDLKYSLDSSKIKKKLAWSCQYSFSEGIKKTVIWYMKNLNNNYFKNKDYKKRIGLKI
jgi:dTDP-glucose 4,6-dehydratase